jgi:hypothetical protein
MKTQFSLMTLFIAFLVNTNAYGETIVGTCNAKRLSYAVNNDNTVVSTIAGVFVDVPGMERTIKIPGNTSTCVGINFSASLFNEQKLIIQAMRDGVACQGAQAGYLFDNTGETSVNYNFICTDVAPGKHIFKIQWASSQYNGQITTKSASMILHHR